MRLFFFLLSFLFVFCANAQDKKPIDSLLNKIDSASLKLDKIKKSIPARVNIPDSLNPEKKLRKKSDDLRKKVEGNSAMIKKKVESMTQVDSLFLFHPEMKKVDSIKLAFQTKSVELKAKTNRKQKQIKHSVDSLQRKCQMQSDALTKKFMSKHKDLLAGREKEIQSKASFNMPAVSSQFPEISTKVPELNLPNVSLPSTSLPNVSLPSTSLPNVDLSNIKSLNGKALNTSAANLNLPNTSLPNVNEQTISKEIKDAKIDGVNTEGLQKESSDIKKWEGEAGNYQKQLKDFKKDSAANAKKVEKLIEDQAQGRREIKALRDKELEKEKMLKLQQQYLDKVQQYKNPKMAEAEIKKNLANVANADLLKNEKVVQSAQSELGKAKKKYGEFQSVKNLPKRPVNPMSQLPLRERIYPGAFFQTWGGKFISLDIAPQVYYKITTRFDVGTGLVYRVNADNKDASWVCNHNLYGFKLFTNFKIYKSFYFRLEGERINRELPVAANSDIVHFRWTNTLLGGIGKEFLISKKIQGNTLVLYNALDQFDSPYTSKVLLRVGFNLSLKKDQRRKFINSLIN